MLEARLGPILHLSLSLQRTLDTQISWYSAETMSSPVLLLVLKREVTLTLVSQNPINCWVVTQTIPQNICRLYYSILPREWEK